MAYVLYIFTLTLFIICIFFFLHVKCTALHCNLTQHVMLSLSVLIRLSELLIELFLYLLRSDYKHCLQHINTLSSVSGIIIAFFFLPVKCTAPIVT